MAATCPCGCSRTIGAFAINKKGAARGWLSVHGPVVEMEQLLRQTEHDPSCNQEAIRVIRGLAQHGRDLIELFELHLHSDQSLNVTPNLLDLDQRRKLWLQAFMSFN